MSKYTKPLLAIGLIALIAALASWFIYPEWGHNTASFLGLGITVLTGILIFANRVMDLLKSWKEISKREKVWEEGPFKKTSPENIRGDMGQGGQVNFIDRGATDENLLWQHAKVIITGQMKVGKTREAAEIIRRAIEDDLVPKDQVFEPSQTLRALETSQLEEALKWELDMGKKALLLIDDLPKEINPDEEEKWNAVLKALERCPEYFVVATGQSEQLTPEQEKWLENNDFHRIELKGLDQSEVDRLVVAAGGVFGLRFSEGARKAFVEESDGKPETTLIGMRRLARSGLANIDEKTARLIAKAQISDAPVVSRALRPWFARPISFLRAHLWLSLSAAALVLLPTSIYLIISPPFPPSTIEATQTPPAATTATQKATATWLAVTTETSVAQTAAAKAVIAAGVTPVQTVEASKHIAFISGSGTEREIYVMDTDGKNRTKLTDNPANYQLLSWSPDGTRIAFELVREGYHEIHVMNANGSNQLNLTDNSVKNGSSPTWSPDGTRIAFNSFRDGNDEIYVMDADGENLTRLTDNSASDIFPAWSPDGMRIAFHTNRDYNWEIYVMNPNDLKKPKTNLTKNLANDGPGSFALNAMDWSPDGKKIVFLRERDVNIKDKYIYVMNANGSNQLNLTDNPANYQSLTWSPDGARIAFELVRENHREIHVMNADGLNQLNLTGNSANNSSLPTWSPDGKRIAFLSDRDDNDEIYVMDADGGNLTRLTDNPADYIYLAWQP